jgi:predicted nucleic acid-binding protein
MARFVVDCGVVLRLASEAIEIPAEHELLAPTLLRSQTLSALHEAVDDKLGWAETYDAEYLALTRLQADAFVTFDAELARRAGGVVPTTPFDALLTA